jgi:hypothetical protein
LPGSITFVHTALYVLVFTVFVLATLRFVPRIWLRHYPAVEKARQPPRSRREAKAQVGYAAIFFGILFGLPLLSAWWVFGSGADPGPVFRHILTMGAATSAVDWLVLDWLLIRWLQPDWIIPAGTDPASWRNRRDIIRDALGFPIGTLLAAGWGWVVTRLVLS